MGRCQKSDDATRRLDEADVDRVLKNNERPELPDPATFVDVDWDEDERDTVAFYFDNGTLARAFMGYSQCRICGATNGAVEYTDGSYLWPEGFAHYIREHNVRPPDDVVRWAVERTTTIEGSEIDSDWWTRATALG